MKYVVVIRFDGSSVVGWVSFCVGGGKTSGVCSFVRRTRKIHGSTKYVIESRSTWKKTTGNNSGKNNSGL